jgi:hypothetical protein
MLSGVRLAQIVRLAAKGHQNEDIAPQLGVGRVQVAHWRERYLEYRPQGIERDLPPARCRLRRTRRNWWHWSLPVAEPAALRAVRGSDRQSVA